MQIEQITHDKRELGVHVGKKLINYLDNIIKEWKNSRSLF